MSDRYFKNSFPDYNGEIYFAKDTEFSLPIASQIKDYIRLFLNDIINATTSSSSDSSVYTGPAGIAMLLLHLGTLLKDDIHIKRAVQILSKCRTKDPEISFLCGGVGPLALRAVAAKSLSDNAVVTDCVKRVLSVEHCLNDTRLPNEILYGRAGYLYTLLYLRQMLNTQELDATIMKTFHSIIYNGESYVKVHEINLPLFYDWHGKQYLGAAHGICGIMYLLMKTAEIFSDLRPYVSSHIIPVVDFMMTAKYPSGNLMSSIGSGTDNLVQWCHGSPGAIAMFIEAYKHTSNEKYLQEAFRHGEVTWHRGLLKKGYGLCHGAAGNAYGFLQLFKQTMDNKWLHRAIQFANFCLTTGTRHCRMPDRPYSLYEGSAGTLYFLADLLQPLHAKFPGYEL